VSVGFGEVRGLGRPATRRQQLPFIQTTK